MKWSERAKLIQELYWKQGLSLKRIEEKLGISDTVVHDIMVWAGIPRRTKSAALKGVERPEEMRQKISLTLKNGYADGRIQKTFLGKHHSSETRLKIGQKSRGRYPSKETRAKMSAKHKGRKVSRETIKKITETHAKKVHDKALYEELANFQKQGYRCIPIVKVIPDAIVVKDGKVFAVELETKNPSYTKYENTVFYDDIIWIVRKGVKTK